MKRRIITTLLLAALASPVLAQNDLPAMVGRLPAVQGQVTLTDDDSRASRAELAGGGRQPHQHGQRRARRSPGRLDGGARRWRFRPGNAGLDDDILRLRLNYGSVSIRVRNPELLRNFELSTPQARITLLEPGLLRVDAERLADTSQIRCWPAAPALLAPAPH
jgi:hypothetical protein